MVKAVTQNQNFEFSVVNGWLTRNSRHSPKFGEGPFRGRVAQSRHGPAPMLTDAATQLSGTISCAAAGKADIVRDPSEV